MPTTSPRVDAYIDNAPAFAQPILRKIRSAFHKGCPKIVETIKWNVPHFEHHGLVGGMVAFKAHVSFGFWKASLMSDPAGLFQGRRRLASMCTVKVKELSDLPSVAVLASYVREAARLNEQGINVPRGRARPEPDVPEALARALRANPEARRVFEAFSPSRRREYIRWIEDAKRDDTRARRVSTAIEWLSEGKPHNWKYSRKRQPESGGRSGTGRRRASP